MEEVKPTSVEPSNPTPVNNTANNGKKKGVILVVAGCLAVGVLCVVIGAIVTIIAATSNKDLPIISGLVDKIEQATVDPQQELEDEYDEMIDEVITYMDQSRDGDEIDMEKFLELWEKNNKKDKENLAGKTSMEMKGTMVSGEEKGTLTMKIDSTNDVSTSNMKGNGNIEVQYGGVSYYQDFEYVYDNENLKMFGKLLTGNNGSIKELREYMNKWYYVSMDDVIESTSEAEPLEMTDEEYDSFKSFLKSKVFLPKTELLDGKTYDGKRTRCVKYTIDSEVIDKTANYLKDELDDFTQSDYDDMMELKKGLNSMYFISCTDRKTKNIYELTMHMSITAEGSPMDSYSNESTDVTVDVTMLMSDYGKEAQIDIPTNAKDLMEEFNNSYDYDYDY